MDNNELWMEIPSANGKYSIDVNSGRIMSHYVDARGCNVHRFLNGTTTKSGYRQVMVDGKFRYVHDLVAETIFEEPIGQKWTAKHNRVIQVDHIDNDKQNNAWWNLQWLTQHDNKAKAYGAKVSKVPVQYRKEFLKKIQKARG